MNTPPTTARTLPRPGTHRPITTSSWQCFRPDTFAGQVTLVTGAAGGMGHRMAAAFHGLGSAVVLADTDHAGATSVADELGDRASAVALDVSDEKSVARVFEQIGHAYGRVDHVLSCAAVITANHALDISRADWQRVMDINLYGTFSVCQQALTRMLDAGSGHIVAVASDAGKRGGGGLIADAAYAASKAGVLSLVKSLAREFAGRGVSINALTPGPTDTPMHGGIDPALKERIAAGLPVGRMGHPDDMAAAAVFLCSPSANFVYGASLNVDGGSMFE